jgi:hypothetical protein
MFWAVGSSFTTAKETEYGLGDLSTARYMLPLASSAKAVARDAARQTEKSMAEPDGLNLVTKAQPLPVVGVPRLVVVTGKSGDEVVPATYAAPVESTAIPAAVSVYVPPR